METNESSVSTSVKPGCPSPACPGHPRVRGTGVGQEPARTPHPSSRAKVRGRLPTPAPRCPAVLCSWPGSTEHPELLILPGTARIAPHSSRDLELGADTCKQGMPVIPQQHQTSIDSREMGTRAQGRLGSCSLFNSKTNLLKISSLGFISWHTCPGLCGLQGKQTPRGGSSWKGGHQDITSDDNFILSAPVQTFNVYSQRKNRFSN